MTDNNLLKKLSGVCQKNSKTIITWVEREKYLVLIQFNIIYFNIMTDD